MRNIKVMIPKGADISDKIMLKTLWFERLPANSQTAGAMNRRRNAAYSGFTPDSLTILAHFSVSAATMAPNPAGVMMIGAMVAADTEDRKSTRLNSSHANISYAVFCLKKKKKK